MASKPYPEKRKGEYTGKWVMKWKPDPLGQWKREVLGDDPRLKGIRPPKTPPQFVIDRHREFSEKEYQTRHGIAAPMARAKGLAGYLEGYAASFATGHKGGSVRQLRRHVRDFLAFAKAQGIASVQMVTTAHLRDYVRARLATISYDTMKTEVRYLSPIWTQAVDDGLMTRNPWSRLKIPGRSSRTEGTAWTEQEIARIVDSCGKAWQSSLVMILANTGLRISTALEMRWDWVHWRESEYGTIKIPKDAAASRDGVKTSYTHLLSSSAHTLLMRRKALKGESDYVFPNPFSRDKGEIVPYDSARAAIQQAIVKSKVRLGTPHDLRRTYGTLLYKSTRNLEFVRRQLGHSSIVTTQKYLGIIESDDAQHLKGFSVGLTPQGEPLPPEAE